MKRKYKSDFQEARNIFDRLNRKHKPKYIKEEQIKLEKSLDASKKTDFWKTIGKIGIVNERKPNILWAFIDENGNVKIDQDSVLNKWKEDFEKLFINDEITQTDSCDQDNFNGQIDVTNLNVGITREKVKVAIVHAKNRKAVGIDDIPTEVLKNEVAVELLYRIISGCFE